MAKKIIEARVQQKIDTEANWLGYDLKLLSGEQAFVKTSDGTPVNFKIGDGTKTFEELPYFMPPVTLGNIRISQSLNDLNSLPDGIWTAQESGTYANGLTSKTGYFTLFRKNGQTWTIEQETILQSVYSDGIVEEGELRAVSGDAVWRQLQGSIQLNENRAVNGDKILNYVQNNTIAFYDAVYGYAVGYDVYSRVFKYDESTNKYLIFESLRNNNTSAPSLQSSYWRSISLGSDNNRTKLTDLTDVTADTIPLGKFLVGIGDNNADFRGVTMADMSTSASTVGEVVPVWNYSTNKWGSGYRVSSVGTANTIPLRNAFGSIKVGDALQWTDAVPLKQVPLKILQRDIDAEKYLDEGIAKYGEMVFVQTGSLGGKLLQVNQTLDGYNVIFDDSLSTDTFIKLADTPNSYTGASNLFLKVNASGSGIEFISVGEVNELGSSIAKRTSDGQVKVADAIEGNDAINLNQAETIIENIIGNMFITLTQDEYDSLTVKNPNAYYFIKEEL